MEKGWTKTRKKERKLKEEKNNKKRKKNRRKGSTKRQIDKQKVPWIDYYSTFGKTRTAPLEDPLQQTLT